MRVPEIDMKLTGKHIENLMKEKGITVKALADIIGGIRVQSIYHWLDGRSIPSIENLYDLADIFNCKMQDILVL